MSTPKIRATHTVAELEVSAGAYDEIAGLVRAAGYDHVLTPGGMIDMQGIGLTRAAVELDAALSARSGGVEVSDEEILSAWDRAGCWSPISEPPEGRNYSASRVNLLCFARAILAAAGQVLEDQPAMWQYREWFDTCAGDGKPGWSKWKEVEPRNVHTHTVADRVREIQGYIAQGKRYVLRALYAPAPRPSPAEAAGQVREPLTDALIAEWASRHDFDARLSIGDYRAMVEDARTIELAIAPRPNSEGGAA